MTQSEAPVSDDKVGPAETPSIKSGEGTQRVIPLARFVVAVLAGWVVLYATIGQRIYFPRNPGEAVPLAGVVTVMLVALLFVSSHHVRKAVVEGFRESPWLFALVSVWTLLGLAGPIVGYPPHTVFSTVTPLSIAAICIIGLILSSHRAFDVRHLFAGLAVIAWVQFIAGLMQATWYTGLSALTPQRWLYLWDTQASVAYGVEQIAGRSVGLYINPNPYSLLGGILLMFALSLRLSWLQRIALAMPAFGIIVLGASRSIILALFVILVPWTLYRMYATKGRALITALTATTAVAAGLAAASALADSVLYSRFVTRWTTMPGVLQMGSDADANLAGRVDAWSRIIPYWAKNPFGTFGPPQMAVSTFTDNDYITLLLQGGIILLVTYLVALVHALLHSKRSPIESSIAPLAALIAFTGVTQTSIIMMPALALFWAVIGTTMLPRHPIVPPANASPRQLAKAERATGVRRKRAAMALSGTLVLLLLVAVTTRVTGRGFDFPHEVASRHARPTEVTGAQVSTPGWRVDLSDGLGMYYVDLPTSQSPNVIDDLGHSVLLEAEAARLSGPWEPGVAQIGGREQVVPIAVAVSGLRDYTRYVATGDERFADFARMSAEWLIEQQEADGSWRYRYTFHDLSPGWASSNVQALTISLLTRVHEHTGEPHYLDAAQRSYVFMMRPVEDGGALGAFDDGQPILEGYANSQIARHVLSGAVIGIIGLHDLAFVTGDEAVEQEFQMLTEALLDNLDQYDIDEWSRYSLGIARGPSSHLFHRLYISELHVLGELTGHRAFTAQASLWKKSLIEWVQSLEYEAE